MHEIADVCEVEDLLELLVHLLLREAHHRTVHVDVLDAGVVRVEAGAELEERTDDAVDADRALGRGQDAGDDLQHGRLAGAVGADDADGFALSYLEADMTKGIEVPVVVPVREAHRLLQAVDRLIVQAVYFRDVLNIDDDVGRAVFCVLCFHML